MNKTEQIIGAFLDTESAKESIEQYKRNLCVDAYAEITKQGMDLHLGERNDDQRFYWGYAHYTWDSAVVKFCNKFKGNQEFMASFIERYFRACDAIEAINDSGRCCCKKRPIEEMGR